MDYQYYQSKIYQNTEEIKTELQTLNENAETIKEIMTSLNVITTTIIVTMFITILVNKIFNYIRK